MCHASLSQSVLEEVETGTQAGTEAETMEECSLLPCLLAGLCLVAFLHSAGPLAQGMVSPTVD